MTNTMAGLRPQLACRTSALGYRRRRWSGSSTRSTRPSRRVWAWGWRSAARSLKSMAAVYGLNRIRVQGRRFSSACPQQTGRIMTEAEPIVFVVDDDPSVRRSMERLIQSTGFKVQTFRSAGEFLRRPRPEGPACLVLDARLPGLSGLDLQRELTSSGIQLPIIFMTAHGDIPMTVRAMKGGAMEFLTKPFRTRRLLDAIRAAIERDRDTLKQRTEVAQLRNCYDLLTPREREVLCSSGIGPAQQTDRRPTGHQRKNDQISSRSHHAEDAGGVARGLG